MDAHTAAGVNREAARILVMMEASGTFPAEVPKFMSSEEGEETEELVQMVYWNPPPRCNQCVAFGHWTKQCRMDKAKGDGGEKEVSIGQSGREESDLNKDGDQGANGLSKTREGDRMLEENNKNHASEDRVLRDEEGLVHGNE